MYTYDVSFLVKTTKQALERVETVEVSAPDPRDAYWMAEDKLLADLLEKGIRKPFSVTVIHDEIVGPCS